MLISTAGGGATKADKEDCLRVIFWLGTNAEADEKSTESATSSDKQILLVDNIVEWSVSRGGQDNKHSDFSVVE